MAYAPLKQYHVIVEQLRQIYLLLICIQYPQYQNRIRAQCAEVMGEEAWRNGVACSFDQQKKFTLLDAVISEGEYCTEVV